MRRREKCGAGGLARLSLCSRAGLRRLCTTLQMLGATMEGTATRRASRDGLPATCAFRQPQTGTETYSVIKQGFFFFFFFL